MPKPLYYTFANHMHWVDMQWLWGYGVLPGSVDDMLELVRATGARGNVNFDGVGYERMAAECPEALARLRAAVEAGTIEPVGCTYGQPYALFHGGESAAQQLAFGVRATRRHLGVRPTGFWEEEFLFFPQLPQLLDSAGFRCACLFFQWTWHTPELPREDASLIAWEGIDGTRLPTLPRNELNVHQWPEDFDGLLEGELVRRLERPAVTQWVELMPSKDWMCRSEVLLPRLGALIRDERFDVRPRTLTALVDELAAAEPEPAVRRYGMDEVWHGMTLGKNADRHPRRSRTVEATILAAEGVATLAGVLGRPYPSWDVYPAWELDEAWRELLAAQHHDNHECEGLCGFVGHHQLDRAEAAAHEVLTRTLGLVADRAGAAGVETSGVGWTRTVIRASAASSAPAEAIAVPPFGWVDERVAGAPCAEARLERAGDLVTLRRGDAWVTVDAARGMVMDLGNAAHPFGTLAAPLLDLHLVRDGVFDPLERAEVAVDGERVRIRRFDRRGAALTITIELARDAAALDLAIEGIPELARPDAGLGPGLALELAPSLEVERRYADTPYAVDAVEGGRPWRRKYPAGDWMTTPQWFEEVRGAFTAHTFVDLVDGNGAGLLVAHDGSQQWFRTERGVRVLLHAYCAWDEHRAEPYDGPLHLRLLPHDGCTHAERVRHAYGLRARFRGGAAGRRDPVVDVPGRLGALEVRDAPGVLAMALRRSSAQDGAGLPGWMGHALAARSGGACTHPWVVRLVEWNGEAADATLVLPGPIAAAARTTILGEGVGAEPWIEPVLLPPGAAPAWAPTGTTWCALRVPMRPRAIATVMADVVPGRKAWRDLDAKRSVWATVHRTAEGEA